MKLRFWLRWSWRDVRKRGPQVLAIGAILALGMGVYAGLGSTSAWRRASLTASLQALDAHDVRVELLGGTTVDPDKLTSVLESARVGAVADVETRLIVRVPVTVTSSKQPVVAAGLVIGVDLDRGPRLDRWQVVAGSHLPSAEPRAPIALLDLHFARSHHLADTGTVRVGAVDVSYVGLALSPEYLNLNTTSGETIQGQSTRAVLYTSIGVAEQIAGRQAVVNDAVIRVTPATPVADTAQAISDALSEQLPASPTTVTTLADDVALRAQFDEIDSEQGLFDLFALIILAGAGFASFNLVRRVVESQRRDIGIAMSLGVPPRLIAVRTMLLAAQIVVFGVLLGAAAGQAIAAWVLSLTKSTVPLPVWTEPWQPLRYLGAALLVVIVPFAAAALPLWRAVRVQPVDALLPPHLRARHHRLNALVRRIRLRGSTTMQAPFRRIVRAPGRALVTVLAVSFIIAPLLAALGATDSTEAALRAGERTVTGADKDLLLVELQGFQTDGSSLVTSLSGLPGVSGATVGLNVGGYLHSARAALGVSISMLDLGDEHAAPAEIARLRVPTGGIVVSRKAAADLGVSVGDDVVLVHPKLTGTHFGFSESTLPVTAIQDSPYRFVAYMDLADRSIMGLDGIVNSMKLRPTDSASMSALQASVAATPGVASVLSASAASRTMRDQLFMINRLFIILQLVIGGLAFLVAFNASNLAADERRREHATMLAFGLPRRRIITMSLVESVVLGGVGVALGLGFGAGLLAFVLDSVFPAALPDLSVGQAIDGSSYLITIIIGMTAVAVAPLSNLRHLRAMDIPSTLRFVE